MADALGIDLAIFSSPSLSRVFIIVKKKEMIETHFSMFYGLRFSEMFICFRVKVKEENVILHRVSFIRE